MTSTPPQLDPLLRPLLERPRDEALPQEEPQLHFRLTSAAASTVELDLGLVLGVGRDEDQQASFKLPATERTRFFEQGGWLLCIVIDLLQVLPAVLDHIVKMWLTQP